MPYTHRLQREVLRMNNIPPGKIGEHLAGFVSILFGFAVFEYVKIFLMIMKYNAYNCLLTPAFIIALTSFLLLIEYWWRSFGDPLIVVRNFVWYFLSILQPMIFYLIGALLSPHLKGVSQLSPVDFTQNFNIYRMPIYLSAIILILLFIIVTDGFNVRKVNIIRYTGILLCFIGAFVSVSIIQYLVSIFLLICTCLFIICFCLGPNRRKKYYACQDQMKTT